MPAAAVQACDRTDAAGHVDPIYAAIERHRAAAAESERMVDLANAAANRALDAFQARLAEAHAAFGCEREMRERARRECGCDEAEAAEYAADKALDAARKALAAATATTFPGLHALARYAVELREQQDEL